jgi:hypothetical protein
MRLSLAVHEVNADAWCVIKGERESKVTRIYTEGLAVDAAAVRQAIELLDSLSRRVAGC